MTNHVTRRLAEFLADSQWQDIPDKVRHEAKRTVLNLSALHCAVAGRGGRAGGTGAEAFLRPAAGDRHRPQRTTGPAFYSISQRDQRQCSRIRRHPSAHGHPSCGPGRAGVVWVIRAAPHQRPGAAARRDTRHRNRVPHRHRDLSGTLPARLAHHLDLRGVRSMAKSISVGNAARNGLAAALLAEQGFTGPEQAIEGTYGFARVMSDETDFSAITDGLGDSWEILTNAYKPYPAGSCSFRSLMAASNCANGICSPPTGSPP
jgi:MmgE/PrpD N-terminal domain